MLVCFCEVSLRKISPGGRSGVSNSRASQNLPPEEKTNSGALTTLMRFCLKTRRFEIALESGSKRNVLVWKVENASKPQYGRRVCSYHVHRVQLTSQRVDSRKRVKTVAWTWMDFRWQRKRTSECRVLVVVWDTSRKIGAIRSVFSSRLVQDFHGNPCALVFLDTNSIIAWL